MEKIDEQLNNISLVEVPVGMHQFVMRRINYKKLQPVLFVAFALLALNFIVIVWHINAKLIDVEFTDMVQDFFEVFSFNFSFINTVLVSFFEIVSPLIVVSAILSLVGTIYAGKKINFYHFSQI
jgi:hypothetical protein